jgi:anti-sigma regulatory factor (Ser/Thr protein kinase)
MNAPEPLTFAALDGLAFAAARGRLNGESDVPALTAASLGPLIEWTALSAAGLLPPVERTPSLSLNGTAPLMAAVRSRRGQWICPKTQAAGVHRTMASLPEDDTAWVEFGLAAQKAAAAAGFPRQIAAQLVGAMMEMVSNIYEHSHDTGSGIVVFRAGVDAFEFVIADSGIGVRESLRGCADYRDIADDGTALQLALREGVSRFGRMANRGHGFRPIFVGLANLSGLLRFRSGDHALVIDGQRIDMMLARTAQKTPLGGFLASVSCKLP